MDSQPKSLDFHMDFAIFMDFEIYGKILWFLDGFVVYGQILTLKPPKICGFWLISMDFAIMRFRASIK